MARSWFFFLKKAFICEAKEKKDQKSEKPKKYWFGNHKSKDSVAFPKETASIAPHPPPAVPPTPPAVTAPQPPPPPRKSYTLTRPSIASMKSNTAEEEQTRQALALATSVAAKAAVAAAQAAAEVVRLAAGTRTAGKSREESAAIKIQTAYRAYMARRALRALRGLVRLKSLIQGEHVKTQATAMLRSMQTLARVQSHVRERRNRMSEEKKARHRPMQQKKEKEPEKPKTLTGEGWDDSMKSKKQTEQGLLNRKEAAVKRERALIYAYSHQQTWRNSSKPPHQELMDPSKPHWGWSWLERWMATHPWETQTIVDGNIENKSIKIASSSLTASEAAPKRTLRRKKTTKARSFGTTLCSTGSNYDSRSMLSERYNRRHSVCVGLPSSVKGDETLLGLSYSSSVKSNATPKQQAKATASLSTPSHLGPRKKSVAGPVEKRLSFSDSPTMKTRQLSDPAKGTAGDQTREKRSK